MSGLFEELRRERNPIAFKEATTSRTNGLGNAFQGSDKFDPNEDWLA